MVNGRCHGTIPASCLKHAYNTISPCYLHKLFACMRKLAYRLTEMTEMRVYIYIVTIPLTACGKLSPLPTTSKSCVPTKAKICILDLADKILLAETQVDDTANRLDYMLNVCAPKLS